MIRASARYFKHAGAPDLKGERVSDRLKGSLERELPVGRVPFSHTVAASLCFLFVIYLLGTFPAVQRPHDEETDLLPRSKL